MNANELAEWLEKASDSNDWGELAKYYKWCRENVSPMLRFQQDEINALREQVQYLQTHVYGGTTK